MLMLVVVVVCGRRGRGRCVFSKSFCLAFTIDGRALSVLKQVGTVLGTVFTLPYTWQEGRKINPRQGVPVAKQILAEVSQTVRVRVRARACVCVCVCTRVCVRPGRTMVLGRHPGVDRTCR